MYGKSYWRIGMYKRKTEEEFGEHKIINAISSKEKGKAKGESKCVSSSSSICYPSVTSRCYAFNIVYFTKEAMKLV